MRSYNEFQRQHYAVLAPVAEEGLKRLKQTLQGIAGLKFGASLWNEAGEMLLRSLCAVAYPTMEKLLIDQLSRKTAIPSLAPESYKEAASAELYEKLNSTDLLKNTSPLLPELLEQRAAMWHNYLTEAFTHIALHREEIEARLLGGKAMGAIMGLSGDGADVHNGGRFTLQIRTEGGCFLYKPHSCMADVMYEKLTAAYFSDITRGAHCLDFGEYGFCEYVTARPARTGEKICRFYYNLGGLCALFQALGSTDLHFQNILGEETTPVLVDVETVLTPTVKMFGVSSRFCSAEKDALSDAVSNSLYQSGILPGYIKDMQYSVLLTKNRGRGLPEKDGEVCTVRDFEDSFFGGFTDIYHRCMTMKREIGQIIDEFSDAPMRRLVRNTSYYSVIQQEMLSPSALQSEETKRAALSKLDYYFIKYNAPHLLPIAKMEAECMLKGDIPYFYCNGGDLDLYCEGRAVISDYIETSGVDNAKKRLEMLSEEEMGFELAMLKQALAAAPDKLPKETVSTAEPQRTQPITKEEALMEAERLFDRIAAAALPIPGGGAAWLEADEGLSPKIINGGFARGTGGLSLFFAMTAKAIPSRCEQAKKLLDCCLEYDKTMRRRLDSLETISQKQFALGLAEGTGGELYRLALLWELGYKDAVSNTVDSLLKNLNKLSFEEAPVDIYAGLAGLLLVMCRYPQVRNERIMERCAEKILAAKNFKQEGFPDLWQTAGSRAISGFGHGMAGIGAALMAAWELMGDDRLLSAAQDTFLFEYEIYSEQKGAWPDRRPASGGRTMHGYCSGAPGIGLALLGCNNQKDNIPYYNENMERAINACLNRKMLMKDHICCGNGSAAEFLISAGNALGRAELPLAAGEILGGIKRNGYRYFPPEYTAAFRPSLFHGAAGTGAVMLRFAYSDLPSPLLR
ncbi:MAG: type 2 lanthipeptide synthetase LanM [Ruminiclostridium sp.]